MQSSYELIQDIIHEKKNVKIPIVNERESVVGYLSPITVSVVDNEKIVGKMTEWRNRYADSFLTKFVATPERTRNWLKDILLTDYSRLLLLIYLLDNSSNDSPDKLIGYLGFKNLTDSSVEGDTTIRGERGGGIKFMHYATLACRKWFDQTIGPKTGESKILSSNEAALNMSLALGYKVKKEVDVYLHERNGEQMILEYGEPSQSLQGVKLLYMIL